MIGIFDSGVGGLTITKEILNQLPEYQIIYFGDTARLPYGTKQSELIQHWSRENIKWLSDHGAELFIIACHTASSWAFDLLRHEIDKPIFDVVIPSIKQALRVTKNGHIGVIGTPGTIKSNIYHRRLSELNQDATLHLKACPLFVPIIEEGWMQKPGTKEIAKEYLRSLSQSGIDTLILGCTHYPLIREVIEEIIGSAVEIIDPAYALSQEIKEFLHCHEEVNQKIKRGQDHHFYFSSEPYHLQLISQLSLGRIIKGEVINRD